MDRISELHAFDYGLVVYRKGSREQRPIQCTYERENNNMDYGVA